MLSSLRPSHYAPRNPKGAEAKGNGAGFPLQASCAPPQLLSLPGGEELTPNPWLGCKSTAPALAVGCVLTLLHSLNLQGKQDQKPAFLFPVDPNYSKYQDSRFGWLHIFNYFPHLGMSSRSLASSSLMALRPFGAGSICRSRQEAQAPSEGQQHPAGTLCTASQGCLAQAVLSWLPSC